MKAICLFSVRQHTKNNQQVMMPLFYLMTMPIYSICSNAQKDKTHRRQCKMSLLTCKGTLRQVFICLRLRTPQPPRYTLFTCKQYGNCAQQAAQCSKWSQLHDDLPGGTVLSSPPLYNNYTLWEQNDLTRTSIELRCYLFPKQLQALLKNITKVLERCQILE